MNPETRFRNNKVLPYLKKEGWFVMALDDSTHAGYPDLLCMRAGRVVFLELKRPDGKGNRFFTAIPSETESQRAEREEKEKKEAKEKEIKKLQ